MALPTILINATGGSDSAASGAGPATALTGTAASTSGDGLTVTLDGSPDLSGVATDGSHVIYLADSTAGARNFGKITGKDDGADTVTVANAFGISLSGQSWAIGGKRASIGATSSRKLMDNNGGTGDAMPGWTIQFESGHTETLASQLDFRRSGDTTDGPITFQGDPAAGTMPVLTWSNNGDALHVPEVASYQVLANLEMRNSNATKTASRAIFAQASGGNIRIQNVKVSHSTNNFWRGYVGSAFVAHVLISGCEFGFLADYGVEVDTGSAGSALVIGCNIHDCTGNGINVTGTGDSTLSIIGNIIDTNGGDGIHVTCSGGYGLLILGNTIYNSTGDGIDLADNTTTITSRIVNNILASNGGYGVTFATASAAKVSAGAWIDSNNTHSNTSGAYNPTGIGSNDPGADPQFTDAANGDFTPANTAIRTAFPDSF